MMGMEEDDDGERAREVYGSFVSRGRKNFRASIEDVRNFAVSHCAARVWSPQHGPQKAAFKFFWSCEQRQGQAKNDVVGTSRAGATPTFAWRCNRASFQIRRMLIIRRQRS